jgi:exodeoxyribonuclease III
MKIVSWNINGIRSNIICDGSMKKSIKYLKEFGECNLKILIDKYDPDIICFQETRCNDKIGSIFQFPEYPYKYWHYSKGEGARGCNRYSGTSIWSKVKPISYDNEFPEEEGRYMRMIFDDFDLINVYTPNSGTNFEYRIDTWDKHIKKLLSNTDKCLVFTGDLNVVNDYIDIWNPVYLKNAKMPSCLIEERQNFKEYLKMGYLDIFRELHPDKKKYSWWNMRTKARVSNRGWRIDYFLGHNKFKDRFEECDILTDIIGSDHCPIILKLKL